MHYVYILRRKNGTLYIGRTDDLKRRISEHLRARVQSTKKQQPELIMYEAYLVTQDAIDREAFLKTGDGRQQIKKQLKHTLQPLAPSSNG